MRLESLARDKMGSSNVSGKSKSAADIGGDGDQSVYECEDECKNGISQCEQKLMLNIYSNIGGFFYGIN